MNPYLNPFERMHAQLMSKGVDRSSMQLPTEPIRQIPLPFGNQYDELHVPNQLPANDFSNHAANDFELTMSKDGQWLGGAGMITMGTNRIESDEPDELPIIEEPTHTECKEDKTLNDEAEEFLKEYENQHKI